MNHANQAPSAVVFAYHDVGVRCLRVLLDAGVQIPLVVTHRDAPDENIWFGSVAQVAAEAGLRCVTPADPHDPDVLALVREAAPDFLFSFYYRHMLRAEWLALPRRGAFNMHGSLLPKYRGRVPVNWAILHGERETGATLHRMTEKPDHGALVDQCAVPILMDDTALDVFKKVTVAAEIVLARSLPAMIDGSLVERPQDHSLGSYFGGRRPEDGRIPRDASARQIHDLVRALAPPYPGAFFESDGRRIIVEGTRHAPLPLALSALPPGDARLLSHQGALWVRGADGCGLRVLSARENGALVDATALEGSFGPGSSSSSTSA